MCGERLASCHATGRTRRESGPPWGRTDGDVRPNLPRVLDTRVGVGPTFCAPSSLPHAAAGRPSALAWRPLATALRPFLPSFLYLSLGVATMRHVRLGKSCGEGSLHWSGGIEIDRAVTIRARESGDKKQPASTCRCRCHPAPVLLTNISGCLLTLCLPPPFVLSVSL